MPNYFESTSSPIFAADFHYFRLPREKWELMLTRLRQMGVNTLAVTAPWGFHEFEQGTLDLNGITDSRRDLVGLLKLCTALKFHCLLNLGPYSRDGILGAGLPLWLLRQTDDLAAVLPEAVTGWFKAVSETLRAQQWPAGPITALQIESEPLHQSQPLSSQLTEVKWRIWLRKHYEGIEALNAAYATTYRTVNEVEFPTNWSSGTTPLARDAQVFLAEVRSDTQSSYRQTLIDAGWQIPIYLSTSETKSDLPSWQNLSLTKPAELAALPLPKKRAKKQPFLILHQPIQIDPDPADIGRGSVWAEGAPIRADGSLRPTFWQVRQRLWSQTLPQTRVEDQTFIVSFPGGTAITRSGDGSLKLDLPAGAKSAVYRLRLSGELVLEDQLRVSRGKLSGLYRAADEVAQTDLLLVLDNQKIPLSDFACLYLGHWLTVQAHTLTRCAELAAALGQTFTSAEPGSAAPERPAKTTHLLAEARRGLSEADAALRKALASISDLEGGFATILGKGGGTPQPTLPVRVSPEIFEGPARDVLAEVGAACAKIAPSLKSAAEALQRTLTISPSFTVEQYRQGYVTAVEAARAAHEALLEVIALLRLEIASEKLPLVAWRVHNQVQELAESLRWGVRQS
jgi:hypothetical protein